MVDQQDPLEKTEQERGLKSWPYGTIEIRLLLGGIAMSDSAYRNRRYDSVVCPSVTLVHPAKAAGWNEMPSGRDNGKFVWPQVTLY